MLHKEVEASHCYEHDERIGAAILGDADMIDHKGKRKGTRKSDARRELFCKEINHRDRENSKKKRNDTQISFGPWKRTE
jgi:hypothetical protein